MCDVSRLHCQHHHNSYFTLQENQVAIDSCLSVHLFSSQVWQWLVCLPRALSEPGPAGGCHGGQPGVAGAGAAGPHLDRHGAGMPDLLLLLKLACQVSSEAACDD